MSLFFKKMSMNFPTEFLVIINMVFSLNLIPILG